ncbi:LacI family DNA-binding transcriptional regulator [Marinimicrococcus flavescens]|uniref:LacI family DNA-binding transcriptional regulator n=1 Tax=Marinimicrococcus flavescens TaxID=3031815 RepID=A0AAP3XSS9_9PROT|nr:LacI family DNA-binding transcriptional regulator [Marinimicrococcus flavescens]
MARRGIIARRPTIKDVARAAGVSAVTVSRVVNTPGQVQQETRERIERAMRELGYVPNFAARAMRTRYTRTIGFLVPELTSYPNAAVAQAAEQALAEEGYCLLVTSSGYRADREVRALEVLRTRHVDGIILYVSEEHDAALGEAVAALDVPLVILDRSLPVAADTVLSDHATALSDAVRYLVGLGHRRIALLQSGLDIRPVRERQRAFEAAGAAAGLAPGDLRCASVPPTAQSATALPLELLDGPGRPSAVIADGSRLLRAVLQAARMRGLAIPRDLSVMGIDAADIAMAATPEITCILRDFHAIGRTAAELMVRRLVAPPPTTQRVVLESQVVLKGSCAAPPS